ncbi:hypothetical protein [Actinoplanes sp. NPDC049599]|uniref:hypothetical protein n=1 Tax=Actinoplanes sp. NPDC049599 TaxID=3363903 RepID=UPI0037A50965
MAMRSVTRLCTASLLAAGALTLTATPALAADVDFGVDIKGTTLALGANEKQSPITFSNYGSTKPSEVRIKVSADADLRGNAEVALYGNASPQPCELDEQGRADCLLDKSLIPAPGGSVDLNALIQKIGSASGKAGTLTVTVEVAGDSNKENDSDTVDVTFSETKGVDLTVFAADVTQYDVDEHHTGKPIPPGGKSVAEAFIYNFGDQTAGGFTAVANLPEGVTFVDQEADDCDFSVDRRSVRCVVGADQLPLPPRTAAVVQLNVVVAPDVKGPVTLQGGEWTFEAGETVDPDRARIAAAGALPDYVSLVDPAEIAELDPADNVDGFAVIVAGPAGGTGGGTGGGDDPGLPVTGPVAGTIAGAGGAALIAGAVMFLVSRRRRVVLVTPGDGK